MNLTTIDLYKEAMKFSAGHFTIFSSKERERLHGHNFTVRAEITAEVSDNGMTFDYGLFKDQILAECKQLNQYFLVPTLSPYLRVDSREDRVILTFNGEELIFSQKDVCLLPVRNITVEELARYFLERLLKPDQPSFNEKIHRLVIKVYSGPGQCGSAVWELA